MSFVAGASNLLRCDAQMASMPPTSPPAPVDGLPPEILAAIFQQLAFSLYDDSFWRPNFSHALLHSSRPASSASPVYSWVRLTQVCQLWRSVALNCPSLWSKIQLPWAAPLGPMLSRSHTAPLTVRCLALEDIPQPVGYRLMYTHATHFGRIIDNVHRLNGAAC